MIISQTPLRISFAGGGTDLRSFYKHEAGMVISTAIDKYVYVIIKERFDDKIYINYSIKEIVEDVSEIKHQLVREAMRKAGIKGGVEISTLADVPSKGSGLGSSSSMTVGLLNAFYNYAGKPVTHEQLAREACEIEIDICKKPIGKQDQYIAAYGGLNKIVFHTDESVTVSRVPVLNTNLLILGSRLLLFYTSRAGMADKISRIQRQPAEDNREILSKMKAFVPEMEKLLRESKFNSHGKLLHENWSLIKSLSGSISSSGIDNMYNKAMDAGALGGKICGADGGGLLLLYVPKDKQDRVRAALSEYRELPFMLDSFGSRIIFNVRTYSTK